MTSQPEDSADPPTELIADIKYNSDVSDAKYWGHFSVCGLLMRYRDLYRSEHGLKPWADIDRKAIGEWIAAKEARWPELEEAAYRDLTIDGRRFDPFDVSGINDTLNKRGLLYGAGYGMYLKPTFFLADLCSRNTTGGLAVFTSGREHVRDLLTAPAMLQAMTVFLRIEPLMALLLYKFSELNTRQSAPLADAFAQYGFPYRQIMDATFEARLEDLAIRFSELLLLHEIAEFAENLPLWKDLLSSCGDRKGELYLRAVKDLVADTSDSGPLRRIIDTRDRGALGLTVALMDGFHRVLFPELRVGYDSFSRNGDWSELDRIRKEGYKRFRREQEAIAALYANTSERDRFAAALRERMLLG